MENLNIFYKIKHIEKMNCQDYQSVSKRSKSIIYGLGSNKQQTKSENENS